MTLEEVSNLMPGDKIFACVTIQNDILNLEIVSNDNNNKIIVCKGDTQYYTIPYNVWRSRSIGRTFEECLCNIINYKFIRKSDIVEKYGKKYLEYLI